MQASTAKTEQSGRVHTRRGSKRGDGSTSRSRSRSNPRELLFLFNLNYKFVLDVN